MAYNDLSPQYLLQSSKKRRNESGASLHYKNHHYYLLLRNHPIVDLFLVYNRTFAIKRCICNKTADLSQDYATELDISIWWDLPADQNWKLILGHPVCQLLTVLITSYFYIPQSVIQNSKYRLSSGTDTFPDFYAAENVTPPGSSSPAPPMTPASPSVNQRASPSSFTSVTDHDTEDPSQIAAAVFYSITSTQKGG